MTEETDAAMADSNADLPEQMRIRRGKLDRLRAEGIDPYPAGFARTSTIADVRAAHPGLVPDVATGERVGVVGRVLLSRTGGKLCFATIRDGSGELQVMVSLDRLGADSLARWKATIDLGDHVGITGEVITSRTGELSVLAESWALTAKCLRPLPDKHKGLADPEARVRQRYVDLIVNADARDMVAKRASVLQAVRDTMRRHGYTEVETPSLQTLHGGASARPFKTHLNAFDLPLFLRIALELYLKRIVVGGIERVYEMGRVFRNEGVDTTHSPEFTELEAYEAYGDYDTMAALTRDIVLDAAAAVGSAIVPDGHGGEIDLAAPWRSVTIHDVVSQAVGHNLTIDTDVETLRSVATQFDVALQPGWDHGQVLLELFEKVVEHTLIEPTFVRDYPASVRPLARPHRDDPRLVEAWDLIINGVELAPAYSELVDPIEQRRRLTEQSLLAAGGDPEAMQLDEDFLRALEYGAPPMGGLGLGIDRLVMLLTAANIRETILFPLVRPE
ncbi:MAG TPA: bifunctional lysylphosphatidylglycerol synthetase/lysine--tRNA ligase LysX [Acidothermaceae bacterium]